MTHGHIIVHKVLVIRHELRLDPHRLRHAHNLDDQTCPTGEVRCPLTFSGRWVVLFPGESSLFPLVVHVFDDCAAEFLVEHRAAVLVWATDGCVVLEEED